MACCTRCWGLAKRKHSDRTVGLFDPLGVIPGGFFNSILENDMRDIHALPAYGRDYKSVAAVLADWKAGKDFQCAVTGQYLSIRDDVPAEVWVRYAKRTKLVRVH